VYYPKMKGLLGEPYVFQVVRYLDLREQYSDSDDQPRQVVLKNRWYRKATGIRKWLGIKVRLALKWC
jgi:hypothetical protein